jgi:hypothetical protein
VEREEEVLHSELPRPIEMAAVLRYLVPEFAGRSKPFRAQHGCTPYLSHDLAARLVDLAAGLGGTLNN